MTTMKGELKTDSQMTTIIPVTMDHNHDNNERRTEMQHCVSQLSGKLVMT